MLYVWHLLSKFCPKSFNKKNDVFSIQSHWSLNCCNTKNFFPHFSHSFFHADLSCIFTCPGNCSWVKVLPHLMHCISFTLYLGSCFLRHVDEWVLSLLRLLKDFPQISHERVSSTLCSLIWSWIWLTILPQMWQLVFFFSFSPWRHFLLCTWKLWMLSKVLPHFLHVWAGLSRKKSL